MNCRTVKLMAIAVGFCFFAAVATNALAADKPKTMRGSVESITEAVPAAGTTPAKLATIKVKDKSGTETSYEILDSVKVKVKGEDGKLSDIKEMDKIRFTLDEDGKIATISKGNKPKSSS